MLSLFIRSIASMSRQERAGSRSAMDLGTDATGFHVTRLTEAYFIVSTPNPIDPR
jgi:hypothetical protein